MTDKAYIIANKQQELEILNKFEEKGLLWRVGRNATGFVPSEDGVFNKFASFPYALIEKNFIIWSPIEKLEDETIVYDGRKEGYGVDTRYNVTQEFMYALKDWQFVYGLFVEKVSPYAFVDGHKIQNIPDVVDIWWTEPDNAIERNNRLIAIIQWLNGEDVFELEKPHKFVVRSKDIDEDGDYWYVQLYKGLSNGAYNFGSATKFDTREEAQEWANSHQVVVEIDEE